MCCTIDRASNSNRPNKLDRIKITALTTAQLNELSRSGPNNCKYMNYVDLA